MCLAVPGRILSVEGENFARCARVDLGGTVREVSLAYVPEAAVGSYVVVHAGYAMNLLDEAEARRTFEYLKMIGED